MVNRIVCLVACLLIVSASSCAVKEELPINYEEYIKKTWVVEDWQGDAYRYQASFSFMITKMEDGFIEGRHCVNPYASFTSQWKFAGTVKKNKAMCTLYGGEGEEEIGTMEITFLNHSRITGVLNLTTREISHKNYTFRPYTLNDIAYLRLNPLCLQAEIDTWGEVDIVTGVIQGADNKPYPAIYIIDESDAILYSFEAGYQIASEAYEIEVGDYDGDGLDDVKIVTYFPYDSESIFIERIFYQTEEGFFIRGGNLEIYAKGMEREGVHRIVFFPIKTI